MKHDTRSLSEVREQSPFVTPPRVLVVADDASAGEAVAIVEALDAIGADAEIRFHDDAARDHSHPDAVIVAEPHGYRVERSHPDLERVLSALKL